MSKKLWGSKKFECACIAICMLLRYTAEDTVGTWVVPKINNYQKLLALGFEATYYGDEDQMARRCACKARIDICMLFQCNQKAKAVGSGDLNK